MVSGIVTALLLLAFVLGIFWLFVLRRASDFDRIARSPLEDNTPEERP
ncbi:MAG: CcoQ/FixQ family Cbb3-type cytochrome c oxidase assembly chaperone [Xanthomonadaceae bacterium]|nr:CcoQ/FixQ family Cbb3-type cytochrome c oxidase assembly chaperone [Xanthomonadaceae bacterium]